MAVRFDAANDRITWTGTAPTPSSGITITLWAYVSVDRNDFSTLVRLHASSGATTVINVATDSGGVMPCIFTAGGTTTGPQNMTVADWTRVAVTVTGTTGKVYAALGSAGATQSATGTVGASGATSPNSGYTAGGRSAVDPDEWFNGRLAHVRVWSSVLTQAEIEAEWASATPVRTSLLFSAYPLTGVGDLLDTSGAARHFTAGSTAVTTEADPPISTAVTGASPVTLPSLSVTTAGTTLAAGSAPVGLPPLTSVASGQTVSAGVTTVTLPPVSAETAGGPRVDGTAPVTVPALTVITSGELSTAGTTTMPLPAVTAAVAGATVTAGAAAASLPAVTVDGTGVVGSGDGTVTVLLPSLAAQVAGDAPNATTAVVALPPLAVALSGAVGTPATGGVQVVLPALVVGASLSLWPPDVTDASVPVLAVSGPELVPWLAVE